MVILALALMAMRSIYIGQLVQPAAAPHIVHMHICLGGVAIIYYYPYPALSTVKVVLLARDIGSASFLL